MYNNGCRIINSGTYWVARGKLAYIQQLLIAKGSIFGITILKGQS